MLLYGYINYLKYSNISYKYLSIGYNLFYDVFVHLKESGLFCIFRSKSNSIKDRKMVKKYLMGVLAALLSAVSLAAVNINTATAEELKTLPGIGPSKAAAIVEYRQQNGQFKSVDDLKNVKGIGEGVLAKLRDEATVGGGAKKAAKAEPALKPNSKK